ncbi:MAG: cobalt ECF transporter T component CbiQ [Eubacteriaceae bacterium]|nr:cobalt ECF transporter T component CbiQ [Eubacteriaceae bacterium]
MLQIDIYANSNRLSTRNPYIKGLWAGAGLLIAIMTSNVYVHMAITVLAALAVVLMAGIKFTAYLKLFRIPASFLLLSIATILVSVSPARGDFLVSVKLLGFYFGISDGSLNMAMMLLTRSLACLSATYFISLTIPLNQIILILKKIRTPRSVIEMTVLMYRFISVFIEEFSDMQNALEMKSGYRNFKTSYRSVSILAGTLFLRVMNSYKDWKTALEVKNYNGNFYV